MCKFDLTCYPEGDNHEIDEATCRSVYNADFHRQVELGQVNLTVGARQVDIRQALTVGIGGGAGAGVAGSLEAGVVYGTDGRYGCYVTSCVGAGLDLGISLYASSGSSISYDAVAGASTVYSASAGFFRLLDIGISLDFAEGSFCAPDVTQQSDGFQGMSLEIGTGLGLPATLGCYSCLTSVKTVVEPLTPRAVCTDYSAIQGRKPSGEPLVQLPTITRSGLVCADQDACTAFLDIDNGSYPREGSTLTKIQTPASGQIPIGRISIGTFLDPPTIELMVIDGQGRTDACRSSVVVADCHPPRIACPTPIMTECAGPQAALNGAPGALVDPPAASVRDCSELIYSALDFPAQAYALGKTPLPYAAADSWAFVNGVASCAPLDLPGFEVHKVGDSFVQVVDTIGPTVTCPVSQRVECQSVGAPVFYSLPTHAVDTCDGQSFPVSCTAPSGTHFDLGTTSMSCSATDASGNVGACGFTVQVTDTKPPALTCPTTQHVECQGDGVARANFALAPAFDHCDDTNSATECTSRSGDAFAMGSTLVGCTARDKSGNQAQCSFNVVVEDTLSPLVTCPSPQTVECSGNRSALATPTATAIDTCDGPVAATCATPDNSSFPLGTTPFTCGAQDSKGLRSSCESSVTVVDTTAPAVTCPAPQTVECTGAQRAAISFTSAAADVCWGDLASSCDRASGSPFALGTTAFQCRANDGSGNGGSCSTTMTVVDTRAPLITCPAPQTVECTGNGQAAIAFSSSANDVCWGGLVTTCDRRSGSPFAVGTTAFECRTNDGSGNGASCSTTMTVVDTRPPTIRSVAASKSQLWPANHKMETIQITTVANDVCDGGVQSRCRVTAVVSNEPDAGTDPDDLPGDIVILGPDRISLRAERDANGQGRVYTATIACTDATGGLTTTSAVTVSVPHDQRRRR